MMFPFQRMQAGPQPNYGWGGPQRMQPAQPTPQYQPTPQPRMQIANLMGRAQPNRMVF